MTHDVLIIGGGSAGYAAARTARDEGANVGIIDHGPLGGLCILRGCMPTKTILRSSDIIALIKRANEFGLSSVSPKANLSAIIDRKARLIGEFADDRIQALKDSRFTLYEERARFVSPHEVQVGTQTLTAKAFIISTGSVVSRIPLPGLEEVGYITSDEALELRDLPESMIVLGGGAVAVELAQFFSRIGTKVTLIQRSRHIMSEGDEDLARPVEARFREEGMTVYTNTQLHRFTKNGTQKVAHFTHDGQEKTVMAEIILQALGRRPNIDGLHLEAAGIKTEKGRVVVDRTMRTNHPHIFAVGDVNGLHEIVHIAIEQGEIAGWNAMHANDSPRRYDDRLKTQVVFTDPQVASVGLSERECRRENISYMTASYPFNDHGKSMTLGETHGHVKLLADPLTGTLLGAHIVGPEAAELIHELIAVMYFYGTVHDLMRIPHYHPTLAEIITYPAEELLGRIPK
ncbi:dihydrolipoyl dehydrogenase [Candidatus Nitronereus thalassa]|uniref:Dihydrolipoyl dehydrogenase n=1 Tax=Candidatus Nitronereus thalassa TaxID=3020898 RepID=A0ABU3KD87_9BACT|nr:dihydrolipoyl dehydrogenase [Candidatus Nitronereus thalassa]MDT7044233.1 dihydrolipoyl dehydrogenase [Candidatus Nitronereus thalassa]